MAQNEMRAMRGMPQCVRLNEGLGRTGNKLKLHENTVRIWTVAAKRPRHREAISSIQVVRRFKGRVRTCLQAEPCVPALLRNRDDVCEYGATCTSATSSRRGTHGLDLTVCWRKFLQRATADEVLLVPDGPKRDVWRSQLSEVQCKHLFWRRELVHVRQVLFKQGMNLGTGQIVDFDAHVEQQRCSCVRPNV